MRAALVILVGVAAAGCAYIAPMATAPSVAPPAPTPIIYVTPTPTPQIIDVTPAPTATQTPTPKPTPTPSTPLPAGHSPSATPFAPEDLAATLPHQVGDIQLDVKPQTWETMFESGSDEPFRRVLAEAGKTPADVIAAIALSEPTRLPSVQINAMRVRGLDPQRFTQSLWSAYNDPPPSFTSEEIDGKTVLTGTDDDGNPHFTYFHGEVAYFIRANTADPAAARRIEEAVLRALP